MNETRTKPRSTAGTVLRQWTVTFIRHRSPRPTRRNVNDDETTPRCESVVIGSWGEPVAREMAIAPEARGVRTHA